MAASKWDPSYLLKQTLGMLRGNREVGPAPAAASAEIPSTSSGSSVVVLSSRDLLLISGAAAVGGAIVAAAVYGTPYLLEGCKCHCSACMVAQQHPVQLFKRMGRAVSSALVSTRDVVCRAVEVARTRKSQDQQEDPSTSENNGSWTCVQLPRDDGSVETSTEAEPGLLPDPYSSVKRQSYLSWDDYFMSIAFLSAQRSKDPCRQVGACLVGKDDIILGIGYNGFPRGCSDDKLPWAKLSRDGDALKTKFPYVCHAEVNAILNRNHASASGQRLYTTMFPCNECAKLIIQAGISEVVFHTDKKDCSSVQYLASRKLLAMADVKVRQHQPKSRSVLLRF